MNEEPPEKDGKEEKWDFSDYAFTITGVIKTDIPAVFIALKRKDTPIIAKIFAGLAVGYALSPIDLIPDFIPVLGLLDDLIIVPFFIALALRFISKEGFAECKEQAIGIWADGKPKKWYYAIPIISIWLFIILLIAGMIWF